MIFRWFDEDTPREMIDLSNTILSYWFVSSCDYIDICADIWTWQAEFRILSQPKSTRLSPCVSINPPLKEDKANCVLFILVPEWQQYGSDAVSLQLKAGNFTLIKDDFRNETIEWLIREKSLYV